jgi:hypothetical protein
MVRKRSLLMTSAQIRLLPARAVAAYPFAGALTRRPSVSCPVPDPPSTTTSPNAWTERSLSFKPSETRTTLRSPTASVPEPRILGAMPTTTRSARRSQERGEDRGAALDDERAHAARAQQRERGTEVHAADAVGRRRR